MSTECTSDLRNRCSIASYSSFLCLLQGRLIHKASNHQKAILSLCLHEESARVTSGGLDGQLKVYDTSDYKVTQNMRFPAPVTAQQLSPDRRHLVVGMSNGLLAIRRRDEAPAPPDSGQTREAERLTTGSYRYFMRGRVAAIPTEAYNPGGGRRKKIKLREWYATSVCRCNISNVAINLRTLRLYGCRDVYLKKFQYQNALDAVVDNGSPNLICSVIEELGRRDGLQVFAAPLPHTSCAASGAYIETCGGYADRFARQDSWNIGTDSKICGEVHCEPTLHHRSNHSRRANTGSLLCCRWALYDY
eukprot:SAG31_NODE_576_length_13956_cov_10.311828_7_plen_304_part_00